jgi:hypothetical protein
MTTQPASLRRIASFSKKEHIMAMTGFSYRLSWADFPGRIPSNASASTGAFVSTSFRANAPWAYTSSNGVRTYSVTSVACSVSLNRPSMWARAGAVRTPALLIHEQGHFEISALLMRQVDANLTALLGQTWSSEDDINQAIRDARDPLFQIISNLQSTSTGDGTYDVSTNHGLNAEQAKWNRAFAACRASPTGELEASLAAQGITI